MYNENVYCSPETDVKKEMTLYIGAKLIRATPMRQHEFNSKIKNCESSGEDAEGYLVVYPDGYKSWSPKAVFEEAYRPCTDLARL